MKLGYCSEAPFQIRQSESEKNLKTLETELEKALSNSKFSNIQEVEKILTQDFNVDSARAEVNNYHKNVNHIEQNLKELRNKVEGKSYDSVLHKELNFEIEEKFTVLEKTKKELQVFKNQIKTGKSLTYVYGKTHKCGF